jgi:hypothetical protein
MSLIILSSTLYEGKICITNDNDRIIQVNIEEQMKTAYIDYSMSVIVGRALPDVRDGFKPVHRRVLYAMSELGNTSNKAYKKSARIVGEVIGKYHPHGDKSIYDTLCVWPGMDHALCWLISRVTSVTRMEIRRQPCVIPRPAWKAG